MFIVYKLRTFIKRAEKLFSKKELEEVEEFIKSLKLNPFVGKPLSYKFLREKKIKGKRIYYLIYKDICLVLIVSASDKKSQKESINRIKSELEEYERIAKLLSNK